MNLRKILIFFFLFCLSMPLYSGGNKWWNPFEWLKGRNNSVKPSTLSKPLNEWTDDELRLAISEIDESLERTKSYIRRKRLIKKRTAYAAELIKRYPPDKVVSLESSPTESIKRTTWKPENISEQLKRFTTEEVYRFYKKRKFDYNYVSHNLERAINRHKIELLEKKLNYITNDILACEKELQSRKDLSDAIDPTHYPEFSKEWIKETIKIKKKELEEETRKSKKSPFLWQRKRAKKNARRLEDTIRILSHYLDED